MLIYIYIINKKYKQMSKENFQIPENQPNKILDLVNLILWKKLTPEEEIKALQEQRQNAINNIITEKPKNLKQKTWT